MSEHADEVTDDHGHGHGHDSYHEISGEPRTTSPMQAYTVGQAARGALVLLLGLLVAYVLPFALA